MTKLTNILRSGLALSPHFLYSGQSTLLFFLLADHPGLISHWIHFKSVKFLKLECHWINDQREDWLNVERKFSWIITSCCYSLLCRRTLSCTKKDANTLLIEEVTTFSELIWPPIFFKILNKIFIWFSSCTVDYFASHIIYWTVSIITKYMRNYYQRPITFKNSWLSTSSSGKKQSDPSRPGIYCKSPFDRENRYG